MFERVCLVHHAEIGLKGRNRAQFERRLRDNLEAALVGFPVGRAEKLPSRVCFAVKDPARVFDVAERIAQIPGVAFVSPAFRTHRDPDEFLPAALEALREAGPFTTFAVDSRRSNTDYAVPSMETNRVVGAFLCEHAGARVNLKHPDVRVRVDVVQGAVYVSSRRIGGVGGLPVGMSGRVVSLLSAGIDSPVATWRVIRRGAVAVGVHFSGVPHTNDLSQRLVAELADVLETTGGLGRVYVVPFGELQREISLACPPDLRVLLYRRLMFVVAERIAEAERASALVTGESLGQVASQTLANIRAVDDVATFPVLRPLIGNDKLEIMEQARELGTYDISIQEHDDCCTLYMPRTPETHARLSAVRDAWAALPHERMVDDALASMSWLDYRARGYRPPSRWPTIHMEAAEQ
ncbi:MAG: tRNA 4-thiouridine(8) synthase ThiI [Coriobacteriia bacterium]|nr:tRNA 4-thiouridine(8) synthase ThiI [Coriobacteriia bacterium]